MSPAAKILAISSSRSAADMAEGSIELGPDEEILYESLGVFMPDTYRRGSRTVGVESHERRCNRRASQILLEKDILLAYAVREAEVAARGEVKRPSTNEDSIYGDLQTPEVQPS